MTDYATDFQNPSHRPDTTVRELIDVLSRMKPETVLRLVHGMDQESFSPVVMVKIPLSVQPINEVA